MTLTASDPLLAIPFPEADTSLAEQFRRIVEAGPDALALTCSRGRFTYAEIDRWSDAIAARIVALAAPPDRPVAIVTADNIELVPAMIAAIKAGHFFVTIDAADPDDRVALLLSESEASLVIGSGKLPPSAAALPLAAIGELQPGPAPHFERPPNESVLVIYTSGTTGKPKGILIPHRHYTQRMVRTGMGRGNGGRQLVSFTAVPGFIRASYSILATLLTGSTLCAFDARGASLDALAAHIRDERITSLSISAPLFRRLMRELPPAQVDVSTVRNLALGADLLNMSDIELFRTRFHPDCVLNLGYAATEVGSAFAMTITRDTPLRGPLVPMGRLLPGVEAWLVDDDGNEVPDGEAGELVVRGPSVISGYWKAPELHPGKFRTEPDRPGVWKCNTGDLARRDADGIYYFVGRKDSRLKIRGRRIDPSEVEAAILAIGGIREAAVVGKPDAWGETTLAAYVVMEAGHPCVPRAIREALRASHPAWMVPTRIHEIDVMPVSRGLKVDRAALAARVETTTEEESGANDELEAKLVAIWSRVTGTAAGVGDDFFNDLGGDSVMAAHLVTAVQRETGRAMPLSLLLELNTIRRMAGYLRSDADASRLAVAVQPEGSRPPFFCAAGKGGGVIRFRQIAAELGPDQPFYGLTFHGFDLDHFPTSFMTVAALYAEAIRRIQPVGPYYIGGYSGGGRMGLEVARLLQRQGDAVALLALFDAACTPQNAPLRQRILNRLDRLRQEPLRRSADYLREAFTRPASWFRERIRRFKANREMGLPNAYKRANAAFLKMEKDYGSDPYDGPVTLFRARNGLGHLGTSPDLGWSAAGVSGLEIIDVPGDHVTLLTDEVRTCAAAFAARLARARDEAERPAAATP